MKKRMPLQENFQNSLIYRSLNKRVYASKILEEMHTLTNWRVEGIAEISLTSERSIDGGTSLRFKTVMRDEDVIRADVAQNGTFSGESGGGTSAILRFPAPQDWREYNRIAIWIYPHRVKMHRCTPNLQLEPNFRDTIPPYDFISFPRPTFHVQHLSPGQWNYVVWEIADYPRDKILGFVFSQELFGFEPGTGGVVTYDIDHIELQQVEAEPYEGWEILHGRLAFSHLGYKPGQAKIALGSHVNAPFFQVLDAFDGEAVLTKPVKVIHNALGSFQLLDFSEIQQPGEYLLRSGEISSRAFKVTEDPWTGAVKKALNFYFCERCNYAVPGLHAECHKDLFGTHDGIKKVINGGWHDAADFSQGCAQTGLSIFAMLRIIQQLDARDEQPGLRDRILEECLWGLDWFLHTRFGDGYRIFFQVARIYTDNQAGTLDDILIPAQNIPWVNLLSAGVETLAYEVLKTRLPDKASQCLKAAIEDWQAGCAVMPDDYLTVSWGAVASVYLHQATGETRYAERAIAFGRQILACQQQSFVDGLPLTGYFYKDTRKSAILHHNHMAFEESPLLALCNLCTAFPEHPDWMAWYSAAVLHAEYFQKKGAAFTAPYEMLIASIYRKSEMEAISDPKTRERKVRMVAEGTHLAGDYYLKHFPVWENDLFTGGTAVLLSHALALTLSSQLRGDLPGEALAERQLHWIFGNNPFARSLMYGEGYDFTSLHAHRQMEMVGALSVGMDCRHNDQPYWPFSNYATQKEIWVVPVSRFLWIAAHLGQSALVQGRLNGSPVVRISFKNTATGKIYRAGVEADGDFKCRLPAGEYVVKFGRGSLSLTLVSGGIYRLDLDEDHSIDFTVSIQEQSHPDKRVRITAIVTGQGRHSLAPRCFNGNIDPAEITLELRAGQKTEVSWTLNVSDASAPWVVVIIPDSNLTMKKELTGAFLPKPGG